MIAYIRGTLEDLEEDKVVIDVGGIGYGVFMSGQSMSRLPNLGEEVKLYTYLNVKEDAMQLYGFLTKDELEVYKLVISVSGIGPKGGLSVLGQMTPNDLRFAVMANDVKAISKAPGIGKKTAEKLILELKDKLKFEDTLGGTMDGTSADTAAATGIGQIQKEAVEALVALGYGSTEALQAVKKAGVSEQSSVEDVLKQALKQMAFI